jgi:hypothetical protein
MGLSTSVQQFVVWQRLNDLNRYLLYFPEENPKLLDQDEIIENLDQAKAPEWHEAIVNANIDILKLLMKNRVLFQEFRKLGEDQEHQQSQSFLITS